MRGFAIRWLASTLIAVAISGCNAPQPAVDGGGDVLTPLDTTGLDVVDTVTMPDTPPGDTSATCSTDLDCTDHLFCNGVERCTPGATGADARGCVAASPANPCATGQSCDEAGQRCSACTTDADSDGHRSLDCGGDDCDEADARRFPGNSEVCDGVGHDEDCNPCTVNGVADGDGDSDSFASAACFNSYVGTAPTACDPLHVHIDPGGMRVAGTDCNDSNPNVRPNQSEACNGIDDNCNAMADEGLAINSYYPDCDGDMYGRMPSAGTGCAPPSGPPACTSGTSPGWATNSSDCDDRAAAVHTGAAEICDGIDNNCDGSVDPGCPCLLGAARQCGAMAPGGGFYTTAPCHPGTQTCVMDTAGTSSTWTGCAGNRDPAAAETCTTAEDDDCNGVTNDASSVDATNWYLDVDRDGYGGELSVAVRACIPPGVGYASSHSDCNDAIGAIHPGAPEVCNGIDDNCTFVADEGLPVVGYYADCDRDGFGVGATAIMGCVPAAGPASCVSGGWATVGGDCNDGAAAVHPGLPEVCNGVDDDCSGAADEGVTLTFYADCDSDGYGSVWPTSACAAPAGAPPGCPTGRWQTVGGDCDDYRAAVHPGFPTVPDVCDGYDNDCDGSVDGPAATAACDLAALPHASAAACVSGFCEVAACAAPYFDCTSNLGCETNGAIDPSSCGACGTTCSVSSGEICSRSRCLYASWAEWPMPNPVATGLPNPSRYDSTTAGVVLDLVTGLMWQSVIDAGTYTQAAAVGLCQGLNLAGYIDWRLPTEIELVSIVDFTQSNPSINNAAFPATPAAYYWSSTAMSGMTGSWWWVDFNAGTFTPGVGSGSNRVRCVR